MTRRRSRVGTVAALALVASGATVAVAAPASAAACPAGTGVTVVVGTDVRCDPDGSGSAASNVRRAGFSLTPVRSQPGFICQVDGFPASSCADTPPPDAYWGIFDSNGTSGSWAYSTRGIGTLTIPTGGWLALTFQSTNGRTYPAVSPVAPPPPRPSASTGGASGGSSSESTGSGGSSGPGGSSGSTGSSAGGTSDGSGATPRTRAEREKAAEKAEAKRESDAAKKAEETSSPSDDPTADTSAASGAELERTAQQADPSSSSTLWVGAALGLALLLGAGATIWQRRARRQG